MFTLKRILSRQSPLTLLFVTASAIFTVEVAIMFWLPLFHLMSPLAEALLDAALLVAVLFPALYLSLFRLMARRIVEREQAEAALREARDQLELRVQERIAELHQANETLKASVTQLEQRTAEITLLSRMAEMLQTCLTVQEAYTAIAQFAHRLFPGASGAVYLINPSRNYVEAGAAWGQASGEMEERVFAPDECWALRRGRTYLVQDTGTELPCHHVGILRRSSLPYLCVPMMVQGEALGVLHLAANEAQAHLTEAQQRLAQAVAEQLSLALANLKLRETLRLQSIRDVLTGLFNRRYLEETLEREILLRRRRIRIDPTGSAFAGDTAAGRGAAGRDQQPARGISRPASRNDHAFARGGDLSRSRPEPGCSPAHCRRRALPRQSRGAQPGGHLRCRGCR